MSHIMSAATVAVLRQKDAEKRQVIVDASDFAVGFMTQVGENESVAEDKLVTLTSSITRCRKPDAAYAVDGLRSEGVLVKDWSAGTLQLDAEKAQAYLSQR